MIDLQVSRRAVMAGMAVAPFLPGIALAGETVGKITRLDPGLDAIVEANAPIEVLASGYKWAEGPVWVKQGGYLLFSDVPSNVIWKWDGKAAAKFLEPSGLAGPIPAGIREAGANGLGIDAKGNLIVANSGGRSVDSVDLKTKKRTILADKYDGKRFSSCNDVAIHSNGTIYFTDPPYGLAEGDTSPLKEMPFNGVYRRAPDGEVHLIENRLSRPNGVALSPDGQYLYITVSDPERPEILRVELDIEGGGAEEPRLFADMRDGVAAKLPGLPDGLKVAKNGTIFSSGPGGIHVYTPDAKLLGVISPGTACANCAFGEDGKTLFLTANNMLAKVRLKTTGW